MPRKGSSFAGLSVALITPFRDGEVDYAALRSQVEFQIAAGTDCLCPVGTTGESPTLSHDEHERVISEVVQASAGRIKVMPGTGSNSTREALRLTAWAAKEGADAALMVQLLDVTDQTARNLLRRFSAVGRDNSYLVHDECAYGNGAKPEIDESMDTEWFAIEYLAGRKLAIAPQLFARRLHRALAVRFERG